MKRTVVYGLGKLYKRYFRTIERNKNIVAHCDKNETLVKEFKDGITVDELKWNIDSYDEIYVTASLMKVYDYLINELHIPINKIVPLGTEKLSIGEERPLAQFYSTDSEAVVLQLLLERMNLPLPGVKYLEIGTHNPVRGSNSYFLYAAGARGVLVDPLPITARLAKAFRVGDLMISAAVTDVAESETATFYESSTLGSSSLHEDFYKEFDPKEHRHIVDHYTVSLIGINELLEQIDFVPDVLLIDAEGEDETIVRSIDFKKYRPKVLMAEIDHCDEAELAAYMWGKGYRWFTTVNYTNAVFVDGTIYQME